MALVSRIFDIACTVFVDATVILVCRGKNLRIPALYRFCNGSDALVTIFFRAGGYGCNQGGGQKGKQDKSFHENSKLFCGYDRHTRIILQYDKISLKIKTGWQDCLGKSAVETGIGERQVELTPDFSFR